MREPGFYILWNTETDIRHGNATFSDYESAATAVVMLEYEQVITVEMVSSHLMERELADERERCRRLAQEAMAALIRAIEKGTKKL
jgi:hypothetical protein